MKRLLLPLLIAIGFSATWAEVTTFTLAQGDVFTGVDGVTVDATSAEFRGEQTIFLERVEDPSSLEPMLFAQPASTSYYRIGAASYFATSPWAPLSIRIPIPEGFSVPPGTLGVGALVPYENPVHSDEASGDEWSTQPATYLADASEIEFSLGILDPEGIVFVVVSR